MTTNHIGQLAEWWENADVEGIVRAGDTIIKKGRAGYDIYTAWSHEDGEDVTMWKYEQDPPVADYRILARASKPEPAWRDAVAVMARCSDSPEVPWEVFTRSEATPGVWIGEGGWGYTEDLRDVTPLIEAKVTDEMIERASHAAVNWTYSPRPETTVCLDLGDKGSRALVGTILAAALGLEDA